MRDLLRRCDDRYVETGIADGRIGAGGRRLIRIPRWSQRRFHRPQGLGFSIAMHKRMLEAPYQSVNDSLRYRNSWWRIVVKLQHYRRGRRFARDDTRSHLKMRAFQYHAIDLLQEKPP